MKRERIEKGFPGWSLLLPAHFDDPVFERLAALDWGLESLRYLYPTQVAATVRAMRGTKGMVN